MLFPTAFGSNHSGFGVSYDTHNKIWIAPIQCFQELLIVIVWIGSHFPKRAVLWLLWGVSSVPVQFYFSISSPTNSWCSLPKKSVPGFDFYPSECGQCLYSSSVVVLTTDDWGEEDVEFHFECCFAIKQFSHCSTARSTRFCQEIQVLTQNNVIACAQNWGLKNALLKGDQRFRHLGNCCVIIIALLTWQRKERKE